MHSQERSKTLWDRANRVLPGGVNSPVRSFSAVSNAAPIIDKGIGGTVIDEDGNYFTDFIQGYGAHILGHAPAVVVEALSKEYDQSFSFGCTTRAEIELAERIVGAVPSIEMLRFVNSGTEATMSACRLARGVTNRRYIVKCDGGYHGHADSLLCSAGSGVATLSIPGSAGVSENAVKDTLIVPYNDSTAMDDIFKQYGDQIAAVIIEPIAGNMGCVQPMHNYLQSVRDITSSHNALLIFDEVMTGFRVSYGSAQTLYGVLPDITCLGKIIGGGFPIGAFGASREIMEQLAPIGPIYQAGTMSGHRLAMVAGCAVLDELQAGTVYRTIESLGDRLQRGVQTVANETQLLCTVNRVGGMLTVFLGTADVTSFIEAKNADTSLFSSLHGAWYEKNLLWPPSQFESAFISGSHTEADIDRLVSIFALWATNLDENLPNLHGLEMHGSSLREKRTFSNVNHGK